MAQHTNVPNQNKRYKIVVGNPERVEKIFDNGESMWIRDNKTQRCEYVETEQGGSVSSEDLIKDIQEELDVARVYCVFDPSVSFVPRPKFKNILTPERVGLLVSSLECFKGKQVGPIVHRICYGAKGAPPCLKLLGALIGVNATEKLCALMDDGMTDGCLPLRVKNGDIRRDLHCGAHGEGAHKVINKGRIDDRNRFSEWCLRFTATYIKFREDKHAHYVSVKGDPLPFLKCSSLFQPDSTAKGRESGGFSAVHAVEIQEGHFDFGNYKSQGSGQFVLKLLSSQKRETFEMELASLLFAIDQKASKGHLIQVLATFEEKNPLTGTSQFSLLFERAEGNLVEFWRRNPQLVRDKRHCKWMAVQFYELARALQCVHNDLSHSFHLLPDSDSSRNLYGRHGDLKPENLLWFEGTSPNLALADFGLGRLHTRVTRSKQDPNLLQRTATYRAPEFDLPDGLVSPASDVFSLGCVYLEYISWFLTGFESAIDHFAQLRQSLDKHDIMADTFFDLRKDGAGRQTAVLKPAVKEWIQQLRTHKDCSAYLQQMLGLIENDMLCPDHTARIRAAPLEKELCIMKETCLRNPSFYLIDGLEEGENRHTSRVPSPRMEVGGEGQNVGQTTDLLAFR